MNDVGPSSLLESVCRMKNQAMKWILEDGKPLEVFKDEGKGILNEVVNLAVNGDVPKNHVELVNFAWKVFDLGREFGGLYGFPK
jgi:hypothetical protein